MYPRLHLLFFLLATVVPSDANVLARGSESFVRAATQAHRRAAKRSASLARDLRLSFRGLLTEQQPSSPAANSRVYCVNSPLLPASNGTHVGGGNATTVIFGPSSSATSPATPTKAGTSTAAGNHPTGTPAPASSPWKLKQQYVSLHQSLPVSHSDCRGFSSSARQLFLQRVGFLRRRRPYEWHRDFH